VLPLDAAELNAVLQNAVPPPDAVLEDVLPLDAAELLLDAAELLG